MDNLIRLYESTEKAFTSGGLGCLSDATKCVVSEERNGEYELELEYPINGIHYSDIAIRRIILCQPNPYDRPQPFRIYSISRPIKGIVTVNAAHVCYDLSNYVCFPFIATSSSEVFDRLNGSHSEQETSRIYPEDILYDSTTNPHGFQFTTDMSVSFPAKAQSQKPEPEDERFKVLIPKPIKTVLGTNDDCILGRFINSSGHRGEYYYDRFHIYLKDPDGSSPRGRKNSGFEIRYGKNMTKVEKEETTKEDYTHILPFWKAVQSSDTTVAVLGGEGVAPVVAVPGATGRSDVKIKIVDLSSEFDKKPNATKLTQYAQDYINDNELTGQASTTITVNFQSLSRSSEYSSYSNLEDVRLCDTVKVIYEALGVNDEKKVIRTDYNVLLQQYDEIEIGDPRDELASTIGNASTTATNTQDAGATVKQGLVETITNAIKLSQVIYYLDTTGQFSEDDPPEPPEAGTWVEESRAIANTWTITEPVCDEDGELFTYSQNRLTDDTINLSDFSFARLATTIRGWVTGDDADEIDGEQLYNQSVNTAAIHDEAITSEKLEVNAVQSRTYTAGSDAHFSTTGTLINLAGSGYIRSKNFAIDSNGNAYFKGQINALSGSIGTADDGFTINSNNIEGTYSAGSDSYNIIIETDGTIMMRPASFVRAGTFTSTVLNEADLRMSSYHDDIGFYDQIDIASTADSIGIGFYRGINSSLTDNVSVKEFAIDGLHREAIGTIEANPDTNDITTSGKWILSSDTYISGHNNQTLKAWIEAIEASGYVLPPATTSTLGGVIVGSGLSVVTASGATQGTISVDTSTIATKTWVGQQGYLTSVAWTDVNNKPFDTVPTSGGLKVDTNKNLVINYGTGLTTNNSDQLVVDTSTIATRSWVEGKGYLTSVSWSNVQNKPFDDIAEHAGLVVSNHLLEIDAGTGLTFDDDSDALIVDTSVVALKSDIKTYTGEKGITISNSYAIGHTNTYTAKSTQAVYPIKIDSYGHISAVGNAVTIPTVNNATLTIQKNGTTVNTFTANASSDVTANITIGWNDIQNRLFDAIGDNGLTVETVNSTKYLKLVLTATNSGLTFDSEGDHGLKIDPTYVALKTDIPTVNNATLTIQKNGTTVKTFTANASSNVTANITIGWSDVNDKPFSTILASSGLKVDSSSNLCINYGTGLTTNNSDQLTVDFTEVATAGHTHTTSIAAGGTSQLNLSANTVYTLTAGGTTYVFKTPADANTATAADNILDGSNSGTQITYAPYAAATATSTWVGTDGNAGKLYLGTQNPSKTTRLNYNGYLYATKLYSGGTEVSVSGHTHAWSDITTGKPFSTVNEDHGLEVSSDSLQVKDGTGLKINSESGELEVAFGSTATTVAAGNHTHTATIAADSGTSALNMAANTKYKLTAGGSTFIFKTPADANSYHTTGSWNGLTYTATANGGAGALAFTIPTGTTSTTVAKGDHTHDISIEATGSDPVSLSANTTYTLTAGGKSLVIKTPADANTATAADNILDGSNSGTQITYAPYSATTATSTWVGTDGNAGKLYLGTQNPSKTTRLNYNGYLYATKLYSGGTEVSVSGHSHAWSAITTGKPFDQVDEDKGLEVVTSSSVKYLGIKLSDDLKFDSESGGVTHSNTAITQVTTAGLYKIKMDTRGHITGYTAYTDQNTTYSLSGALASHKFTSTLTAGGSGSGTSTADITFAQGSNITLTDDTTNRKITIAATNSYHTTGSWNGLTYTATANGGAGALAFTIPTGATSTTVAAGNHTHDVGFEPAGSDPFTLSANTTYTLSAGGSTCVFKTPADTNTATAADNILDGSNSGTQITYAPYAAATATSTWVGTDANAGKLYLGTQNPSKTTRLNYNGYLYATKLYSGGKEVSTTDHTHTYYWANIAIQTSSATNKSPQFADMTATNVKLYASSAVKATMTYNTTTDAIDFNFA